MSNIQRKRKSDCSVPDVASILKKLELKKRKVKVNKNLVKIKSTPRVKSNLKSDGQSKKAFLECNETDMLIPLITKNCSQAESKRNHQDKKAWKPPTKQHIETSSKKHTCHNDTCQIQNESDINYTMYTENTDNFCLEYNKSDFEKVTEDSRTNDPIVSNTQIDKNVLQTSLCNIKRAALNENKTYNDSANLMLKPKVLKYRDDSLLNKNQLVTESELMSLPTSFEQSVYGDAGCSKQSSQLEDQKNNSTNLKTTSPGFTQLNKKNNVNEYSENDVDISEKIHDHSCACGNAENSVHALKENTLINSSFSSDNTQSSKHYLYEQKQEKCLNIILDTNLSQTNREKNYEKYEEYDDEELTITHSQLNHIEKEFSKTNNNTLTGMQMSSNPIKQSSPIEPYATPSFKVLWNRKVEEDGKKLRQIVQELRKINESLLKIRSDIWPTRNNFSSLPKTT